MVRSGGGGSIAVSLHDVEPATFERCALIRDWLNDLGVDRVTLLVIPAPDLHPFHDRRPDLAEWLDEAPVPATPSPSMASSTAGCTPVAVGGAASSSASTATRRAGLCSPAGGC